MIRFNLTLFAALVICALALVTSQHRARTLFGELEREREEAKRIDVEFGQLQLEQSTWAMHARIEKIAGNTLRMRTPPQAQVRVLPARAGDGR
jgi:cell division protein FtsL